jgi:2,3-bisphosphoglycerate-independent phosphoglycerate mutase
MTEYDEKFTLPIAFPPHRLTNILATVLEENKLTQLRAAETEKYPHVTFFFNGGEETPVVGEDRCLIPSPKVATYDLQPEMSAAPLTDELVERIKSRKYDVIILNYANADMVGHTGSIPAAIAAVETTDRSVGRILAALEEVGGAALITADHGNAERMLNEDGQPFTAHTTYPVHIFYFSKVGPVRRMRSGILADVAPTMLELLGITPPPEMTGKSLFVA